MRLGRADLKTGIWVLALFVGATGPGFAQDGRDRLNASGEMTKQQLLKSLEDLEVQLQALQRPPASKSLTSPAIVGYTGAREAGRMQLDLERLQALKAPDAGLEASEARERESGVGRLQRHQRELTSQKLGDQLIILNTNP